MRGSLRVEGAPIVTVSFGARRTFRLRPWRAKGLKDFDADDASVFVLPYETNLAFTHEVPHSARVEGRRISVTLRAFVTTQVDARALSHDEAPSHPER